MRPAGLDWALLVLRCGGMFLALTFGRQKVADLANQLHSAQPLSTWGMTQFLRHFHLPFAEFLGVLATLNESVFSVLITAGLLTRFFSLIVSGGMVVAFCISLALQEDPIRALLYVFIFGTLWVTGPGRISIDYLLGCKAGRGRASDIRKHPAV